MKKLLYYIVYALWYLLSLLPFRVLYWLSDFIFVIVFYVIHYRRRTVWVNIVTSFPEREPEEHKVIERNFYRWFCDYLVESIKLMTMSREQLKRRMVFKGTELVNELTENGQSIAAYLGHYCNWEWVTSLPLWVTPKAQCGQIYHVLENSEFDKLFLDLRQRHGAVCIPMAETLRRLAEYRQKKQPVVIGYISDQVPFWNNIHHWLDFLNHDTPVLTGTERLARSAGHAVFYIDVERPKRGYYVAEFKLIARDPKQTKDYELTDAYFKLLEESIKRAPQYWLWTHNRWKRTHEEFNIRYDEETGRVSLEPLDEIMKRKGLQ